MIIEYFGHPPCMLINKSPSKVVCQKLSIPLKKEKEAKESEPTILLEQKKKKEDKGKDGEAKVKHHSKGHSSLTHTCT